MFTVDVKYNMGLMFVEIFNGTEIAFGRYIRTNGWGNSPPNPTDGKLMHIYFYRNYILLKSDIHFNKCVMLL